MLLMASTVIFATKLLYFFKNIAKFNFAFAVFSKESNRERSLCCMIIQFASEDQMPLVARFDILALGLRFNSCFQLFIVCEVFSYFTWIAVLLADMFTLF